MLLGLGISGLSALSIQLHWSNKSKKYVFMGFVVWLSLIPFCADSLACSAPVSGSTLVPPAARLCRNASVDLWKWFPKNNIWDGHVPAECGKRAGRQHLHRTDPAIWFLVKANILRVLGCAASCAVSEGLKL